MILTETQLKKELEKWQLELKTLENSLNSQILELKQLIQNSPQNLNENRLKEIEIWQSKLHNLMIEKTPAGKEKLNKNFIHLRGRL